MTDSSSLVCFSISNDRQFIPYMFQPVPVIQWWQFIPCMFQYIHWQIVHTLYVSVYPMTDSSYLVCFSISLDSSYLVCFSISHDSSYLVCFSISHDSSYLVCLSISSDSSDLVCLSISSGSSDLVCFSLSLLYSADSSYLVCFSISSDSSYLGSSEWDLVGAPDGDDVKYYLMVYGILAGANSLFTLARAFLFAYGGICAAVGIHKHLLSSLLKVKYSTDFSITCIYIVSLWNGRSIGPAEYQTFNTNHLITSIWGSKNRPLTMSCNFLLKEHC